MKLLSIIMPVYNAEKYLEKAINSILCQENISYELILVNDGSQDSSLKICQRYAQQYSNIILIDQENKGVSEARNVGLHIAKGKYVAFLDADDYLTENAFSCLRMVADETEPDILIFGYKTIQNNIMILENSCAYVGNADGSALIQLFKNQLFGLACNKWIRKEILEKENIEFDIQLKIREDQDFMFRVWKYAKKIVSIKEQLYCYIQHPESAMACRSVDIALRLNEEEKNYIRIKTFLLEYGVDKKEIANYGFIYAANVLWDVIFLLEYQRGRTYKQGVKHIISSSFCNCVLQCSENKNQPRLVFLLKRRPCVRIKLYFLTRRIKNIVTRK